ncbi:FAD-dependent oxidoreductase [Streptomyces sp. NPDC059740]|uniref:FAD-dependent oxidoreductase n=1 Tax=Streptomyces sp. NPDC059740 TaxID=3346926 RepID=UPI00364BCB0E
MSTVRLPGRALDVLHDVDATVAGAGTAGVETALHLARGGRRVLLLEEGFAPCPELAGAGRPWADVPAQGAAAAGVLAPLLAGHPPGTRVALRPAALKLCVEDALRAAGVELLYGTRVLAPHRGDGPTRPLAGLVVTHAGGRDLVLCRALVDAVPGPGKSDRAVWSVEFTRVRSQLQSSADHPAAHGLRLVPGHLGTGHRYVLPATTGGRHEALRAAARLLREHPDFTGARLGAVGHHPLLGPHRHTRPRPGTVPGIWHLPPAEPVTSPHAPLLDPTAVRAPGRAAAALVHEHLNTGQSGPPPAPAPPPPLPGAPGPGPTVRERRAPRPGAAPARQDVAALDVPLHGHHDVLVVGGGTSGASAALAAAAEGARTLLLEHGPGPGGTGTHGGVPSYWFGRRTGQAARVQNLTRAAHRALGLRHGGAGAWSIEAKSLALHEALTAGGVEARYGARAFAALAEGDRVCGVLFTGPDGVARAATAEVVVDATGEAHLAAWAGAPVVRGAATTHSVMWSSLAQFATPDTTRNNFGGLADLTDPRDATRAVLAARRRTPHRHDHGSQPVTREGRHLVGRAVLTLTDQLTDRRWPDVVNVHFANHDLKGKGEALWPQLGLIPPNLETEVPYRALLPTGLEGLLVTGKALSATHDALPALRMQADLENLGAATGVAAALCARTGTAPGALPVDRLQQRLTALGLLPPERVPAARVGTAAGPEEAGSTGPDPARALTELARRLPLHGYSDMGRREVFRGRIPFVDLVLDPRPTTTAQLTEAMATAEGPARLALAQILVCRGARAGTDVLLAALDRALAPGRLPQRDGRIREAQLPPDQSAMPEAVYLLHTLSLARDPRTVRHWQRVADLLTVDDRTLRDSLAGVFYWVEAVANGAERLGDPRALPVLRDLHARPALHGQWRRTGTEPDDFQERRAMLELALARARAQCGDEAGVHTLLAYLDDNRAPLAAQAHTRLRLLWDLPADAAPGPDTASWRRHLARAGVPRPRPLPWAHDPYRADLPAGTVPGVRPAAREER